jgi:two-component system, cell cycle response regulator
MARVLVIEDNAANLELMRYLLQAFGHIVVTATDGEQGAALARDQSPDLVLCDLQLPGIDGLEVARRLKSDPRSSKTPVVAVTAFAMVGDRDKVLAAGFDGYIAKPIDPEKFVEQAEIFLGGSRSRSAAPIEPAAQGREPSQKTPPQSRRASILCVDDSKVNLHLLRSLLEPCGFEVETANTVQEALNLARQKPPALFIADVHMPKENGYDFLRKVKADPLLASIPLLFLTSSVVGPSEEKLGVALGARKLLMRPVEPEFILAAIEDCLRTPSLPST